MPMTKSIVNIPIDELLSILVTKTQRKRFLRRITNAEKFWNVLAILAYVVFCAMASLMPILASVGILGAVGLVHVLVSDVNTHNASFDLWIIISAIFWVGIIMFICETTVKFIYDNTIKKFNNWLNAKQCKN